MDNQLKLSFDTNVNMQALGLQAIKKIIQEFIYLDPSPETLEAIELRLYDFFGILFAVGIPDESTINIRML